MDPRDHLVYLANLVDRVKMVRLVWMVSRVNKDLEDNLVPTVFPAKLFPAIRVTREKKANPDYLVNKVSQVFKESLDLTVHEDCKDQEDKLENQVLVCQGSQAVPDSLVSLVNQVFQAAMV